jgi:MinD-like ATPase involved in chromosome partitioning or flagellar assembly
VPYEPAVEAAVNQMNPFPLTKKKNKATTALEEIAMKILKASRLPKWLASRDNHDEEIVPAERLAPQPS